MPAGGENVVRVVRRRRNDNVASDYDQEGREVHGVLRVRRFKGSEFDEK